MAGHRKKKKEKVGEPCYRVSSVFHFGSEILFVFHYCNCIPGISAGTVGIALLLNVDWLDEASDKSLSDIMSIVSVECKATLDGVDVDSVRLKNPR